MEQATEEEKEGALFQGINLTYDSGLKTLERFGIEQVEGSMGDQFNAEFHEAMFDAVVPGQKEGTIIHIVTKGYKIEDRILRAAKVGVARKG